MQLCTQHLTNQALLVTCSRTAAQQRSHAGFLKQFMGVCKPDQGHGDLAAVVSELSGGRAPARVLCCGHSLGGALATLGNPSLSLYRA